MGDSGGQKSRLAVRFENGSGLLSLILLAANVLFSTPVSLNNEEPDILGEGGICSPFSSLARELQVFLAVVVFWLVELGLS